MKKNTEVHITPHAVTVFEGGTEQVATVVKAHASTGRLPEIGRALAKGLSVKGRAVRLRFFNELGAEVSASGKAVK